VTVPFASPYKYEDPLHKLRPAQPLSDVILFDAQGQHTGQFDLLASAEDIADATVFREIRGRPFHAQDMHTGRPGDFILDNIVSDIDNEALFGLYGETPAESTQDENAIDEAVQNEPEREQPQQQNSEPQYPEADIEYRNSMSSGIAEPIDLTQEESEPESVNDPQSNIRQDGFESGGDEPEELEHIVENVCEPDLKQGQSESGNDEPEGPIPQAESEQEQELGEDFKQYIDQGGYETDDLEPDHAAPSHEAGDWRKRLSNDRNSTLGPSMPAYTSPYAIAPIQKPYMFQSGSAESSITVPDSPVQRTRLAPSSESLHVQNQMPGLTSQPPRSTANGPSPRNAQLSQPALVPSSFQGPSILAATRAAMTRAQIPMPVIAAAPSHCTLIGPVVIPPPAPAIASLVAPTPALGWAAFVAPTPAAATNPAGFAAAHALIARTPFRSQGKKGPYAIQGQDEGDFLAFILNAFVPQYFRKFHPTQSIPADKRNWYRALPQWEQDRCRRFIQEKVEAELPGDVAAEVKRLREDRPIMAMGGGVSSRMSVAINTGLGSGLNGRGNATVGPLTATRGVKARQSNMSQQGVSGSAAMDLQNVPRARMQDAADLGLRLSPGGGVGAVQEGHTAHQPSRASIVPNVPNKGRYYQQQPYSSDKIFGTFEDSTSNRARPPHHYRSPLPLSPFSDFNLDYSLQPNIGSGYQWQTPYQTMASRSVGPVHRQHSADLLNGEQMTQFGINDGVYRHQEAQRSAVVGESAAGQAKRHGIMYTIPAQNIQSQQFGPQSRYQIQDLSANQRSWVSGFDSSNFASMYDAVTAEVDMNGPDYRRNQGLTEMGGARSTSGFGSDWAGVLHTNSNLRGSKRKSHDDEHDDDVSIDSGARPTKLRRT
jgi:hypothetical protein